MPSWAAPLCCIIKCFSVWDPYICPGRVSASSASRHLIAHTPQRVLHSRTHVLLIVLLASSFRCIFLRLINEQQILLSHASVLQALIAERNSDAIAYYTSLLPEEKQIELFSKYMEEVGDATEKSEILVAAEKYDLNIKAITEKVVQNIRYPLYVHFV